MNQKEETKRAKGLGWQNIYNALRAEILCLVLAPGQLLDETTLAERFGMSRSPVREALIRLAGEELVVTLPNHSAVVVPLEIATFPQYIDALDITQRMNSRLAAECRTQEDLKIMARLQRCFEAAIKTNNHLTMSAANKDFHMAVAHAGRNPYLAGFYERLLDQGRRMMHLHFDYLERSNEGYLLTDEHGEMLEAIRARDVARADELAHAHTRQFRDSFIDFLCRAYKTDIKQDSMVAA